MQLPDVGLIAGLEDFDLLDDYFASFMIPAKDGGLPGSKIEKVSPPDWDKVENQKISSSFAIDKKTSAGGKALEA